MGKVFYFGQKSSPEIERGIRLLSSYGYKIKKDKGYYEVFDGNELVGYTKNSPNWIDPVRNFKGEFKNPKLFDLFKKFVAYLDFLEIPYPFDKNKTGLEIFVNSILRELSKSKR